MSIQKHIYIFKQNESCLQNIILIMFTCLFLFILLCVIIVERGGMDFKWSGNYYQKYFLIIVTFVLFILFENMTINVDSNIHHFHHPHFHHPHHYYYYEYPHAVSFSFVIYRSRMVLYCYYYYYYY